MKACLALRTRFSAEQLAKFQVARPALVKNLQRKAGLSSLSLWRRYDIDDAYLVLAYFDAEAGCAAAVGPLLAAGGLAESRGFRGEGAVDVLSFAVRSERGEPPENAPAEGYISLSLRVAEPGQADELMGDIETTFRELEAIDGLRGWSYGQRLDLPEEVVGIVAWADFSAYEASLPFSPRSSDLRVYRRCP